MSRGAAVQRFIGSGQGRRGASARVGRRLRTMGPYLFIELLLPGGTLFSLLLFLYRRGSTGDGAGTVSIAAQPLVVLTRIAAGVRSLL